VTASPVVVRTKDEFGEMATSFNRMQDEAVRAALALDEAVGEQGYHELDPPVPSRRTGNC